VIPAIQHDGAGGGARVVVRWRHLPHQREVGRDAPHPHKVVVACRRRCSVACSARVKMLRVVIVIRTVAVHEAILRSLPAVSCIPTHPHAS